MSDLRVIIRQFDDQIGLFAGDAAHLGTVDFVSELDAPAIVRFTDGTPFDNEEFTVPGRANNRNGKTTKTITQNSTKLYPFEVTTLGDVSSPINLRLGVVQNPQEDRISYYFKRPAGNLVTAIYRIHFNRSDTSMLVDIQNGTTNTQTVSITQGDATTVERIEAGGVSPIPAIEVSLNTPGVALTVDLQIGLMPTQEPDPLPPPEFLQGGGTTQIEIIVDPIAE